MKFASDFEQTTNKCYGIIRLETGHPLVMITLSYDKAVEWLYNHRTNKSNSYKDARDWWIEQCTKVVEYGSYASDATFNNYEIKSLPLYE